VDVELDVRSHPFDQQLDHPVVEIRCRRSAVLS
jgi:hypothetical protein